MTSQEVDNKCWVNISHLDIMFEEQKWWKSKPHQKDETTEHRENDQTRKLFIFSFEKRPTTKQNEGYEQQLF